MTSRQGTAPLDSDFSADSGTEKGILVWRIEKLHAVPWPKERYGELCTGDSYIILHTIEPKERIDLFFWLGDNTSVDERGAVAYKTVELDQQLGDVPVQYRECQGSESKKFVSVWKQF